jgi:hypothetical protein
MLPVQRQRSLAALQAIARRHQQQGCTLVAA